MEKSRNATFEFVQQVKQDQSAKEQDSDVRGQVQTSEEARKSTFEFVRQLAAELSDGTFELPPFPDTALRVRDALSAPDASVDTISRIVLSEPVLSARLLRMANSALMRRGTIEVTDLRVAISRLGFDMVRNAAVSLAMDSTFVARAGSVVKGHIERTRKHSVEVAALSYVLARRHATDVRPDEAMLTGLLHDIGRFYILTRLEAFPDLFQREGTLEELMLDWHTGVGRAIVESWGFSESIAVAVDEHEVLDREHTGKADMADVVLVANLLAHRGDPRRAEQPAISTIPACGKLKIDEQSVLTVLAESAEEVKSMAQALGG